MAAEYLYRSPKTDAEWESAHVAAAKRLLKLCQVNRGIYVKLGQHVSQLQHLLPQPYVDTMRAMCSQAPRSATPLVHKVLAEELGGDWAERLCDFEPIPVASASLAQVHRAIDARTGRALAVKVQHSGLRETSAADIVMVSAIIDAAARLFPKFDYTWLAEELALNLPQELDFEREGRNAERTAALFADDDAVVVPRIHWDLSTSRVLTMDFEEGCHVDDVAGITAQGLRTADVARVVSHTFARQIFLEGFVHCDPHAGNMLVRPKRGPDEATADAQLVLLDHGLYRELTDRFRRSYAGLWASIVFADERGIEDNARALGVGQYHLLAGMLTTHTWDVIMDGSLDRLAVRDGDDKAKQKLKTSVAQYADEIMALLRTCPRELLLLFKTNDCLRSIDVALGAPINTHEVMARCCAQARGAEALRALEAKGRDAGALERIGARLSVLREAVAFEWRLRAFALYAWLANWLPWLRRRKE